MPINILQRDDGSMTLGGDDPTVGFINESTEWIASSVDKRFFTATRPYRVKAVSATVTVAGTDGSAVTAAVRKVPSGTAIGSGTALHAGSINLKGTADTVQDLALSTSSTDLDLADGDSLAIDFTGTLTSATGVATVTLAPKYA
ncbi:hypothetical protein FRZ61_37260 [Hypericibacter adhaerens]|uniref:Uncharacterized protein n=1 Tax=Hypericibacter adhaerens TaxID=2602016 RepID=A0A5J6N2P0_9PROT|nr:hypothetical protein [Hypericibacter adhaerens]QEX23787.1 hypothetical protein FRZ61_37260 [Hypericibacter adhaerens]